MPRFIKLSGKLVYDPHRRDLKKTFKQRTLIVQLPRDDLTSLFRWFIRKRYWLELQAPVWGSHVTIVRGDEHGHKHHLWGAYAGRQVDVLIDPHISKHWRFWVAPVKPTADLIQLRHEVGCTAFHDFHLTVGREYAPDQYPISRAGQ